MIRCLSYTRIRLGGRNLSWFVRDLASMQMQAVSIFKFLVEVDADTLCSLE